MNSEKREYLRRERSRIMRRRYFLDQRIDSQAKRYEESKLGQHIDKLRRLLPLNMTRAQVVGMFGLATNVPVDSKIVIEEQIYFGDIIVSVESEKAPALNNRYRLPVDGGRIAMADEPKIDTSEESAEE